MQNKSMPDAPAALRDVTDFLKTNPGPLLDFLRERFPRGMHLNAQGVLTEPGGSARKVTDLAQLGEIARAPRVFQVEFRGEMIEFQVRGLNAVESAEGDKLNAGILPPQKFRNERGARVPDGYDITDPEYVRKRDAASRIKDAYILSKGLVGLDVPGATLDDKAAFIAENFTPQIVQALTQAIIDLTSTVLDKASFI